MDATIKNALDLNRVLAQAITDLRAGNLHHDTACGITKLADKLNKNNMNAIEYKRITKHTNEISFFNGESPQ